MPICDGNMRDIDEKLRDLASAQEELRWAEKREREAVEDLVSSLFFTAFNITKVPGKPYRLWPVPLTVFPILGTGQNVDLPLGHWFLKVAEFAQMPGRAYPLLEFYRGQAAYVLLKEFEPYPEGLMGRDGRFPFLRDLWLSFQKTGAPPADIMTGYVIPYQGERPVLQRFDDSSMEGAGGEPPAPTWGVAVREKHLGPRAAPVWLEDSRDQALARAVEVAETLVKLKPAALPVYPTAPRRVFSAIPLSWALPKPE